MIGTRFHMKACWGERRGGRVRVKSHENQLTVVVRVRVGGR